MAENRNTDPAPGARSEIFERSRYRRLTLILLLVHAVLAATLVVSGDEAYYWDASRQAELSYFDQPGMVIWVLAAGRMLLGSSALAVRLPALLAFLGFAMLLPALVRRLGGSPRQAGHALLLTHAMPIVLLGFSYTSTDVAMTVAYVAVVLGSVTIAQGDRKGWWIVGLASGLGFLAKYPIVVALATVPTALSVKAARDDLKTPIPWLAATLSAVLTLPVWLWERQHDFAGLRFQLSGRQEEPGWHLRYLLEFFGGSLALASPILAVALIWALLRRRHRPDDVAWRVALTGALAPFLFFGLVSLRSQVAPHWSAPGLLLLVIVATLCVDLRSRWLKVGVGVGLTMSVLTLSVAAFPTWPPSLGIAAADADGPSPLIRIVGQRDVVAELESRQSEWILEDGDPTLLVASDSYSWTHTASLLSAGRLETRLAFLSGGPGSHGLASLYWHTPQSFVGRDVLVFSQRKSLGAKLEPICTTVEPLEPYRWNGGILGTLEVWMWRCGDLHSPAGVFSRL